MNRVSNVLYTWGPLFTERYDVLLPNLEAIKLDDIMIVTLWSASRISVGSADVKSIIWNIVASRLHEILW